MNQARDSDSAKLSYQFLRKISELPKPNSSNIVTPDRPEDGHKSRMTSIRRGERDSRHYWQWDLRVSYHDILDNELGYLRGAQINLGSMQIRKYQDEGVKLQRLDLIDILSLPPKTRFLNPLSWQVRTGWERTRSEGKDILTPFLQGGMGVTYPFSTDFFGYALLKARLEHNSDFSTFIDAGVGSNFGIYSFDKLGSNELNVELLEFSNNHYRYKVSWSRNFVMSTDHSLRFGLSREWHPGDRFNEFQFGYRYFF